MRRREGGKTYVSVTCPGCFGKEQLLLSESDKTLRLFCPGCCLHRDADVNEETS